MPKRQGMTVHWLPTITTLVALATLQSAIVLASAAIITGMLALVRVAMGLGVVGIVFRGIGFFAPLAAQLFNHHLPTELARGVTELIPGVPVQSGPITSIEVTQ